MNTVAVILRSMQFYAHAAHNLSAGPTFFADHEYLGELYAAYEAEYDDIIERMIGLGVAVNIPAITQSACVAMGADVPSNPSEAFATLLETERKLCAALAAEDANASLGTQDLLQTIAGASEKRQYKLGQRCAT